MSKRFLSNYADLLSNWHLIEGDAEKNTIDISNDRLRYPRPDYLFLDSFHSARFGEFYVSKLLPEIQKKHTFVSLHDVYNPSFWSDNQKGRDLEVYPGVLPNEEGIIVLDWLAFTYLSDTCNLFTFAPSKLSNKKFHERVLWIRSQSGLNSPRVEYVESSIYFELGCGSRIN